MRASDLIYEWRQAMAEEKAAGKRLAEARGATDRITEALSALLKDRDGRPIVTDMHIVRLVAGRAHVEEADWAYDVIRGEPDAPGFVPASAATDVDVAVEAAVGRANRPEEVH